jgi:UDP-4-amino-4,6-dideoxy-N-acetyl-beta-L-altrosamine N-acetyltransferase
MLRGNRIILRDIRDSDIGSMTAWRNDPEVSKYFFHPRQVSMEEERRWVEALRGRKDELLFIIAPAGNSDRPVGSVGFTEIDLENKRAEFGRFLIEPSSRGKGFGSEALFLTLRYAFSDLKLRRLHLEVYEWNASARLLYERFGFKLEGIFREHIYRDGQYQNAARYGLLEPEFRESEDRFRQMLGLTEAKLSRSGPDQ